MGDFDLTSIVVAVIAAIASIIGGYFAYKAATRVKTQNGHDLGELADFIAEEMAWLRITVVEHIRDRESHRGDGA